MHKKYGPVKVEGKTANSERFNDEEKGMVKGCAEKVEKETKKQFGRYMNLGVSWNKNLLWKEIVKRKSG